MITWVDDNQYISGTDTGITIESDDTFVLNADNSATITTPLLNYKGTIPNLQVETTTTSHYVLLTMIAHRGGSVKGEGFQMKVDGGTMTISSDHSTSGTYDDTILTLSGGSIDSLRTVGIGGALTVSEGLDIEGDIDMATGKKITWVDDNQYISGTATGITIESDDTFVVNADTSMTVNTESTIFRHTNNADVTIRSDNTSNGLATLTMISDNGDDLGDGWQIKSSFGDLYFSSDHTTNETYDTEIMRLSNHETQSSRIVYMNSQLQVKENMKMEADKLLYWEDTSTYITGNTTGMTIESDDTLVINADTSITFNCGNITMSSLDVELLDISNKITIDRSSNLTNSVSDLLLLVSRSNGTPAAGIGVGISFQMETADNNIEIGARIEAVATDVDSTNEDVDLVFYTMLSGDTATEALRVHDDGNLTVAGDLTSSGGNITGNLDVGSGLDVTGSITCSSDLDIEGDIDMATGKKITWVDDNQ